MTAALIVSGTGRYADPWHPFSDTSARIADLLTSSGIRTEIADDVDERMARLASERPDLLVINVGDPALNFPDQPDPAAEARGRAGLLAYLADGGPLLGVHSSSTSFRSIPEWKDILGGTWVRGQSFHPDYGPLTVRVNTPAEPFLTGLADFDVPDERYTDLSLAPGNTVLASQVDGHREHPLVWARTYGPASARVICDLLGHDAASYRVTGHQELMRRCVDWLLQRHSGAPGQLFR